MYDIFLPGRAISPKILNPPVANSWCKSKTCQRFIIERKEAPILAQNNPK